MLTSFSVRTRIVVLALIPVVGFLANGLTYVSGERDVDGPSVRSAIRSARRCQPRFQDRRRGMRIAVKDFTASPHGALVDSFEQRRTRRAESLDIIEASVSNVEGDNIKALRAELDVLHENFDALVRKAAYSGFNDHRRPARRAARRPATTIERVVNENMSWVAGG